MKKVSNSDIETHHAFLQLFLIFLKIKERPVITYDYKHAKKHCVPPSKKEKVDGLTSRYGTLIFIHPKIVRLTKLEQAELILHECLHVKYPDLSENDIREMTAKYIFINPYYLDNKKTKGC